MEEWEGTSSNLDAFKLFTCILEMPFVNKAKMIPNFVQFSKAMLPCIRMNVLVIHLFKRVSKIETMQSLSFILIIWFSTTSNKGTGRDFYLLLSPKKKMLK